MCRRRRALGRGAVMETWAFPRRLEEGVKSEAGVVHVILVPTELSGDGITLEQLENVLSPAERERIARLRDMDKRMNAVISRGVLRHILGTLLMAAPEAISIQTGEQGKPFLAGTPVHFNVAHTEGMVVVAVAADQELGVDIEYVRDDLNCEAVARTFFTTRELAELQLLPGEGGPA